MAVPTILTDISATASSNFPTGSESVGTSVDDYFRGYGASIRGGLAHKGADIASASTTDLGAVAGYMHDITGTTTITSFGTVSAGIPKVVKFEGVLTLTHNATSLILPGGASITTADGDIGLFISEGSGNWRCISYQRATGLPPRITTPTVQVFTSGSGTYTTPTGVTRIHVRLVGAGGGGRDGSTSGGTGGNTTFSTLTGSGGVGGVTAGGAGGAGGAAAGGDFNVPGGSGTGAAQNSSASVALAGGTGGSSYFGGGGGGGAPGAVGLPGATNSGGGGGGSGVGVSTNSNPGGGAGGYVEKVIAPPSATYSYAVGAAGTSASTNTGAAGIIVVNEFYD